MLVVFVDIIGIFIFPTCFQVSLLHFIYLTFATSWNFSHFCLLNKIVWHIGSVLYFSPFLVACYLLLLYLVFHPYYYLCYQYPWYLWWYNLSLPQGWDLSTFWYCPRSWHWHCLVLNVSPPRHEPMGVSFIFYLSFLCVIIFSADNIHKSVKIIVSILARF